MVDPVETPESEEDGELPIPIPRSSAFEHLRPAILSVLLLTLLTGVVFPLVLAVLGRTLFPRQSRGSLIDRDGLVGSELIGQEFTGAGYFHSRPSAAGRGFDGSSSGGTNLVRPTRSSAMVRKTTPPLPTLTSHSPA